MAYNAPLPPYFDQSQTTGQPVTSGEMLGWGLAALFIPLIGLILPIIWLTQKRPGALSCLVTFLVFAVVIPIALVIIIAVAVTLYS